MTLTEENAQLWRLIGRVEILLKCRKRGPPRRDRPPNEDRSCRARMPEHKELWCPICRFFADADTLQKGSKP